MGLEFFRFTVGKRLYLVCSEYGLDRGLELVLVLY